MKIGVITSAYPEFKDDPHGIFVHRLMQEISKQGHDILVIAPYTGGKKEYTLEGINVERYNYFYPRRFQKLCGRSGMIDNVKEGFLVKLQIFSFLFFNVFYSLSKLKDMDIVHVQWPIPNGLGALFLKKIYKIPYINTIHGEEVYLSKRYHTLFALKWLVNNSSKTITNSSATRDSCLEVGLNGEKFEVIPFGVNTNFFKPLNILKNDKYFQILSVGYLIERKGHEYLIKAIKKVLKKHDDVRLKIVGSGPLKSKLINLINELKLKSKVEIVDNIPDEKLLFLYNSSDLFVLPSIVDSQGNTEGLGVVLLEAMACGLPVIGSDVGGISDIIKNGENGILVSQKNIVNLTTEINKMIENEFLLKKYSFKGYEMIYRSFNWNKISENYLKIMINLIKNEN